MPRTKAKAHHTYLCQLAAGSVEVALGIIRECTVAKSGVPLKGHTLMLDKNGGITKDEKLCVKKIPIFTDDETLDSLMTAAGESARFKVREDHDDSVGARAGFVDAFKKTTDGRVVTDLHVFNAYRNRAVLLETAEKTPEEIGLSIDFTPRFELKGDHALMRVVKLHAVDVVDEGAITPGGLLLGAGVDSEENPQESLAKTKSPSAMADEKKETPAPDALAALTQLVAALGAKVDGCMTTIGELAKMSKPAPAADSELKASVDKLTLTVTEQGDRLKSMTADHAKLKRERALLGLPASERQALGSASAEDIEAANAKRKSYLDLVADLRTSEKLSASAAHAKVRQSPEGATAYAIHLSAKGVTRIAA